MCILFIAVNQHPQYPLIVCANRDEFYSRPTLPLHEWQNAEIIAGKDLQGQGTWLGINKRGHFSALTNIRRPDLHQENKISRGELVIDALNAKSNSKVSAYIEKLQKQSTNYNPYNLIFERNKRLYCFNSITQQAVQLTSGFHSVCNGSIDDIWPKMAAGNKQLEANLSNQPTDVEAQLLDILQNKEEAPIELLPNTGIDTNLESKLSSIFVQTAHYGTRSSVILTRDSDNNCHIVEIQYDENAKQTNQSRFNVKR